MYSYEEYKRYTWKLLLTRGRIIGYSVLELWILLLGFLMNNPLLILLAIVYPILIVVLQNRHIKKVWHSNKVAQNMEVKYDFYDTYFTATTGSSEERLGFNMLHKIIETKTNFYLMISKNQGFILNKSNFPEGLAEF